MAVPAQQRSTERVVVLLQPQEKKRLERLARKERVSSAEIVRRSLAAYAEPVPEIDSKTIGEMNATLDKMLANIRSTRNHVQQNLAKIEEMRSSKR
ncbi:MAG TPA: CopG family transcriptional regulator [Acidobacteriaceae bacterium]|jgi:guanylate kinase|nr:CopG family transcriptional regulator [Acidobacteriaceae bacterium]